MKKIIILIALIFMIVSCSDIQEMDRQIRERGQKCVYDAYGNIECGFIGPPVSR